MNNMSSLNDNESAMLETVNLFPDDFLIGMRLDKFLSDEREDMSRSYIQQLIDAGNISVNDKKAKASYKIRKGDKITLAIPEPEELSIEPENIPLDIVYDDNDTVIYKAECVRHTGHRHIKFETTFVVTSTAVGYAETLLIEI